MHTEFAPAEKASGVEVRRQSGLFPDLPVLKRFMDTVPSIVTVLNRERQIVFANHRLFKLLGMDPSATEAVYGRRPGEVLSCSHAFENAGGCGTTRFCSTCGAAKAILASQRLMADMQECRIIQVPDGRALDLRAWATPLPLDDELFTIFSLLDISHEKRREMLERLFFHDVLNTAGGLKGSAELVRGADPREREELHGIILSLAHELIEEIETQRQLAEAESNDLVFRPAVVDTVALLEEVADQYARHEVAVGVTLCVDPRAWRGAILTGRTILRRVMGNMVKNALEASRAGDTVSLGGERGDGEIVFWVNNPGFVPEEVQLQIFNRSFSTKGAGRGLGTYSIKLFTEQYLKGSVSFTSSREAGTTFRVSLPDDCVVEQAAAPVGPKEAGEASRPLRILLADDNPVNRRVAAALLERRGHRVTVCANGREAVDQAAKQAFDLVLMDIQMPEMDGMTATQAIRAKEAGSGIRTPILAMTGLSGADARNRCLAAGMDGSVSKPVRPDELDRFVSGRESPPVTAVARAKGPEAFDPEELLAGVENDRGLLKEMVNLFMETAPGLLTAIGRAAASGDAEALERSAHALKGAAANFFAHDAVAAAQWLEQAGRDGEMVNVAQGVVDVEGAVGRLTEALVAVVEKE
ncbi:MAG: response regulator [Desulfobacterales bacterium]|nr:response regulator [Desulfobacterales bacterium]